MYYIALHHVTQLSLILYFLKLIKNYVPYKKIITSTGSVCLLASLLGGFFGIVISDL